MNSTLYRFQLEDLRAKLVEARRVASAALNAATASGLKYNHHKGVDHPMESVYQLMVDDAIDEYDFRRAQCIEIEQEIAAVHRAHRQDSMH